jgi:membrane-bound ClpP family serine protease
VFYKGEYWTARADQFIPKGAKVRIKKISGLTLTVDEIKKEK